MRAPRRRTFRCASEPDQCVAQAVAAGPIAASIVIAVGASLPSISRDATNASSASPFGIAGEPLGDLLDALDPILAAVGEATEDHRLPLGRQIAPELARPREWRVLNGVGDQVE